MALDPRLFIPNYGRVAPASGPSLPTVAHSLGMSPAVTRVFGAAGDPQTDGTLPSTPRLPAMSPEAMAFWEVASTASAAAGAYHGWKRNESVGWAVWWGAMGALFPVITPAIAVAQGFSEKAKK